MVNEDLCAFCSEEGFEVEIIENDVISRCPRCLKSTLSEMPAKEQYEKTKKEREGNEL